MSRISQDPTAAPGVALDRADERLVRRHGARRRLRSTSGSECAAATSAACPVVLGIVVIAIVFYVQDPTFLSSRNLVNITLSRRPYGIIASASCWCCCSARSTCRSGSVSGLAAVDHGRAGRQPGRPLWLGIAGRRAARARSSACVYGLLYTRVGVPSFVITLAGLLGFLGLQLVVLGDDGTINLPRESGLVEFARQKFLTGAAAYVLVVLVVAAYVLAACLAMRRRKAAGTVRRQA